MKKMNKKGFTLIELLAVILILGIIALIAIPTVNTVILEARIGAWRATANQVVNSYKQYSQICDMRPACTKTTAFLTSSDEGYAEGDNDLSGDTVKKVLEMTGDMPAEFATLSLSDIGDAYIAFTEDGVSCWNYGSKDAYPTTFGKSVSTDEEIFDVVCAKAEKDAE